MGSQSNSQTSLQRNDSLRGNQLAIQDQCSKTYSASSWHEPPDEVNGCQPMQELHYDGLPGRWGGDCLSITVGGEERKKSNDDSELACWPIEPVANELTNDAVKGQTKGTEKMAIAITASSAVTEDIADNSTSDAGGEQQQAADNEESSKKFVTEIVYQSSPAILNIDAMIDCEVDQSMAIYNRSFDPSMIINNRLFETINIYRPTRSRSLSDQTQLGSVMAAKKGAILMLNPKTILTGLRQHAQSSTTSSLTSRDIQSSHIASFSPGVLAKEDFKSAKENFGDCSKG